MSRRKPVVKGNKVSYKLGFWPDGPFDHEVPVLRITDPSGKKLQAVLFGYACRGRTPPGRMIYGGFAGFARDFLRKEYPGAVFLFMTGCGGDQNPFTREGSYDDFRAMGRELAQTVNKCIQGKLRPINGPLTLALEPVTLVCEEAPSQETLEEWKEVKNREGRARAAALLDQLKQTGKISTEYAVPIQVIRFGQDLLMIALPGEPVVDYSLQFKKAFASKIPTWVAGFCNDSVDRLPTLKILREGGDEGGKHIEENSLVLSGPFDETVEKRIVQKVHELVEKTATTITETSRNGFLLPLPFLWFL